MASEHSLKLDATGGGAVCHAFLHDMIFSYSITYIHLRQCFARRPDKGEEPSVQSGFLRFDRLVILRHK